MIDLKTLADQVVAEPIGATLPPVDIQIDENRNQTNLRPYEQGLIIKRALARDLYTTRKKMAESLGISERAIGQALKLVSLPVEVINAFPSPLELQFKWGTSLQCAIYRDREAVIDEAKTIQSEMSKPTAKNVLARLTQAPHAKAATAAAQTEPSAAVTPEVVATTVPASDVAKNQINAAAANTSDEDLAAKRKARQAANKLDKLAKTKPDTPTAIAEVVEPAKKEYRRMTPEEVSAFVRSLYRGPSDLRRSLDQQTPKQLEKADKAWRKKMGR